jgi:hypothetical protein
MPIDYAKPFAGAQWFDVLARGAARPEIPALTLLHAGPPFRGAPPVSIINAAVQALLFEGMADDPGVARDLLSRGEVCLRPAQDHGIVTPLAQVVSASMLLVAVRQGAQTCYAPIVEGPAPALRFGCAAPECLQRLRAVGDWVARGIAPWVRRAPPAIDAVIGAAVAAGDDCHARTAMANAALVAALPGLHAECIAKLRANPAFVLPIMMAAAAAALRTHRCEIKAIGGNGVDFGVRRRGAPGWRHIPAAAPVGLRFPGSEAAIPLGAIGDSAVIDFCGLGAQALSTDALARREALIDPHSGIVDPERVVGTAVAPLINLAMLDHDATVGLIGRGVYSPSVSLFSKEP